MTGLTILLFCMAGLLLAAAIVAIYAREQRRWSVWWGVDDGDALRAAPNTAGAAPAAGAPAATISTESAEVDVVAGDVSARARRRAYPNDVFRYTIRRPESTVRKTMPDLGGFSEVPLRLYDQLGNRFTVHQKVRLN